MEEEIHKWIKFGIDNNKNVFSYICEKIDDLNNKPANNLLELKNKNTKVIGNYFEVFTKIYLKYLNYQVFLLKDVSDEILLKLKLERKDMGIDIIAEKNGEYFAVQCKYKSNKNKKYTAVSWKELSTFYSLCARTGPWKKNIVVTSANFVRIQGGKKNTDLLFTKSLFENIDLQNWKNICNYKTVFELTEGNKLNQDKENKIENKIEDKTNQENPVNNELNELRNKRLQYLKNIGIIKN